MSTMTLYVTNLPEETKAAELTRLFAEYGRVAVTEIWAGQNGSTGQWAGVIDMHNGGEAALVALNGLEYRGRKLAVGLNRPWDPA
jgi:hypothetical protein